MEHIRQKVVAVLMLLGIVFALFRCGSGSDEVNQDESVESAIEHSMETNTLDAVNKKTLFVKSAEQKEAEAAEAEKLALAAKKQAIKEKEQAAEKARLEAAAAEKAEADKLAREKMAQEEKLAAIQAENDKKSAIAAAELKFSQDKLMLEQYKSEYLVGIHSVEKAMDVVTKEKERLVQENERIKQSEETLLSKITHWENKARESEADVEKIKADFQAKIDELEKKALDAQASEQSALEKLKEEKKALEIANTEMNATIISMQEAFLTNIEEWKNKVREAEDKVSKLKIATAAAATLATQQAVAKAISDREADVEKIKADFQAKIDELEKKALDIETTATSEKKALEEENAKILASKEALLVKIDELEKKAHTFEKQDNTINTEEAEKLKSTLKSLEDEKANLQAVNEKVKASEKGLLLKIEELEKKVQDAESRATKLKATTAAATLLATQQAVANVKSKSEVDVEKIKADFQAKIDELEKKALDIETAAASEKKALEEENAKILASKEALLGKIAEWEKKAKDVEKEVDTKKATKAQALEDAKKKLFDTLELTKIEFKHGSAMLLGNSEELLNSVSQIMHEHPEFIYDIQGHTDAYGNEDYNIKLSTSRAEAVKQYLINKGIDSSSLRAQGFGSSMPIADNATNEGRLQNRRVVIKIVE